VGTGEPNASADPAPGKASTNPPTAAILSLLAGSDFAVKALDQRLVIDPTNTKHNLRWHHTGIRGYSARNRRRYRQPAATNGQPAGLYKSVDGGNTFTLVFSPIDLIGFTRGVNHGCA